MMPLWRKKTVKYREMYLEQSREIEFAFNKMENLSRRLGTLNVRYRMEKDKNARLTREVAELKDRLQGLAET